LPSYALERRSKSCGEERQKGACFYGGVSRPIRYVPEAQTLLEVTVRTLQGRLLLRPSAALNEIILGILSRAQETYGVKICAFSFLANHFHLLLVVDTAKQLSTSWPTSTRTPPAKHVELLYTRKA